MAKGIQKDTVKLWLRNYHAMDSKSAAFETDEVVVTNSGPKSYDGVGGRQLNKIMLDQAIAGLHPYLRMVVHLRWTSDEKVTLKQALKVLGVGKDQYYARCDQAIDYIHRAVNGWPPPAVLDLVEKILKSDK